MRFYVPGRIMRWLGPCTVAAIGAAVIIGNPISLEVMCNETQNCLVTWVGALSGWAAALAAAVTVRSLFQQAKAAQHQTDFQLGDAEPTLDAVQHAERKRAVVLRIRNWNRRSMIIRRIKLVTERKVSVVHISFDRTKKDVHASRGDDWTFTTGPTKKFEPALIMEGWVNRADAPPLLKLTVSGYWEDKGAITDDWKDIPIEIQYELAGLRAVSRLQAHVHLASATIATLEEADLDLSEDEMVSGQG